MAYIKTRVDGKAAEHLYPWLEAQEDREIYVEEVIQCLENVFEDPDRRLKAREHLKKLRMAYLGDFNNFQSEFIRLANSSKMPRDQWKEELHDRLYDSLRVQMEIYVAEEDATFEDYCRKAQHFARGLARAGENTKERAKEKKSNPRVNKAPATSITIITIPVTPTRAPPADITCYNCGEKGHVTRICPHKQKPKVK